METGIMVIIFVIVVVGLILLGAVFVNNANKSKAVQGVLNVDYSDPEDGPYLFLELKVPISDVVSKKQVIFDVNVTNYISQK